MMRDLNLNLESNVHPRFCDTPERERYCFLQYIHYTIKYLPRFIDIDVTLRC